MRDPLTSVYARTYLRERFEEEIERAQRYEESLSLLLIDLDHFKSVNDAFGHPRGDEVLIELVQRLQHVIRGSDLIFRYGGDEFLLLLPNTSKEQALALAGRLLERVHSTPFPGEPPLSVSISIGVASLAEAPEGYRALLERVDMRLYGAKRAGRDQVMGEDPAQRVQLPFEELSRLVEREDALGTVNDFLTMLPRKRRGVLIVAGTPGSGKTRFLREVAKAARLRGYKVIELQGSSALLSRPYSAIAQVRKDWVDLLLTAGQETFIHALQELLRETGGVGLLFSVDNLAQLDRATLNLLYNLFSSEIPVLAAVYSVGRVSSRRPFPVAVPLEEVVELRALSPEGFRIWLRSLLQWEAPERFLQWLYRETGGLPASLQRGLSYLVGRGILERCESGWNLCRDIAEIELREKLGIWSESPPHNLPVALTGLVGRDQEIQEARTLLQEKRLLTILGPGGIGKTRIAVQVAAEELDRFSDGVYFVPLGSSSSAEFLIPSLAAAVSLSFYGQDSPRTQLLNYLREKELLLLLDSFEHLVGGAELLSDILTRAAGVKILVTSRERLNLQGESILEIQGLEVPPQGQIRGIEHHSAVQLFLQSARRVHPAFVLTDEEAPSAAQICRLVEGFPLGIELAASWVRVLSCREIAAEIEQSLDFLTTSLRDVPDRHRSLRAVFDYSWDLLCGHEQAVLGRLSLFRGGFRRESAAEVAGATLSVLSNLVDKSFLRRDPSGRYEMLEVIRQYAEDKLDETPEQKEASQDLLCAHYAGFLRRREQDLKGWRQQEALQEIGEEIENVRTAWSWALARGKVEEIGRALESLFLFYEIRSWFLEGVEALGKAVEGLRKIRGGTAERIKGWETQLGRTLARQGVLLHHTGRYDLARERLGEALDRLRRLDVRDEIAFSLIHLGFVAFLQGEAEQARQFCQEGLEICRVTGDRWRTANALTTLGLVACGRETYVEAKDLFHQSLALCREMGDRWGMAFSLNNLGYVASLLGEPAEAKRLCEEGLLILRQIGHQYGVAATLDSLGNIACTLGEYQEGEAYFREALQTAIGVGALPLCLEILVGMAALWLEEERPERAAEIVTFVLQRSPAERHVRDRAKELLSRLSEDLLADRMSGSSGSFEQVVEGIVGRRTTPRSDGP